MRCSVFFVCQHKNYMQFCSIHKPAPTGLRTAWNVKKMDTISWLFVRDIYTVHVVVNKSRNIVFVIQIYMIVVVVVVVAVDLAT